MLLTLWLPKEDLQNEDVDNRDLFVIWIHFPSPFGFFVIPVSKQASNLIRVLVNLNKV